MRILLLGVNHRTAAVDLREKLALAVGDGDAAVADLHARFPGTECVVLSTCNRIEFYLARPTHQPPTADDLRRLLAQRSGLSPEAVTAASIHREGEQAVQHLFRVCTGLDSMVLGEPQVLGQVKRAYEAATAAGAVGPVLHRVFQGGLAAAKRLRTQTGIGVGRVSVASVAVDFARRIFDTFGDKTVLAVGAGEMAKATLQHLLKLGPGRLWVLNRSAPGPRRWRRSWGSLQHSAARGRGRTSTRCWWRRTSCSPAPPPPSRCSRPSGSAR